MKILRATHGKFDLVGMIWYASQVVTFLHVQPFGITSHEYRIFSFSLLKVKNELVLTIYLNVCIEILNIAQKESNRYLGIEPLPLIT